MVGTSGGDPTYEADEYFKREHAHGLRQTPRKRVGHHRSRHVRTDERARAAATPGALGRLQREAVFSDIDK